MLISDIRDEICELVGDTTDEFKTKVFSWIKSALRRFPRFSRPRLLITTSYATLSAGEHSLPIPSYFIKERDVYYLKGNKRKRITKLSYDKFNEVVNQNVSGKPAYYRIVGTIIEFNRKADADTVIYLEHTKTIDGVSLSDTFGYPSDYVEILKDGVLWPAYKHREDDAKSAEHLGLFKAGLDELGADYVETEIPEHIEEA